MSHPSLHTHIPECNSSMTHNQILCRSNHPHPSLTSTLSHCIISLLQEKTATLRHHQRTKPHECKVLTNVRCTPPVAERHLEPDPEGGPIHHRLLEHLFGGFENGRYRTVHTIN